MASQGTDWGKLGRSNELIKTVNSLPTNPSVRNPFVENPGTRSPAPDTSRQSADNSRQS